MGCGGSTNTKRSDDAEEYDEYQARNKGNKYIPRDKYNYNNNYKGTPLRNGETQTEHRYNEQVSYDDFPEANDKGYKRRIRNNLIQATAGTDIEALEKSMEKFENNRLEDCGDLTRARERLQYLKLKRNLRDAIRRSNVGVLEKTISDAESSPYAGQLRNQIDAAHKKLENLRELNMYNHDILTMDQATISEIHSYPRPPACVHDIMAASYMLLGHDEKTLRDWSYLQSMAGRVGRDSLINQVREFDSSNVDRKTSKRVKEILTYHDLGEVRLASNGAATFHVWASNVVDLLEKDYEEADKRRRKEEEDRLRNKANSEAETHREPASKDAAPNRGRGR